MQVVRDQGDGAYVYGCTVTCEASGRFGFSVRVIPAGDDWIKFTPGLITWASE